MTAKGGKPMRYSDWSHLWFDSAALAFDASAVIGLRMAKLAQFDTAAISEAQLMLAEKVSAASELQWMAMTGDLGHTPQRQAAKTIRHLHRKVIKNRSRLAGKRG